MAIERQRGASAHGGARAWRRGPPVRRLGPIAGLLGLLLAVAACGSGQRDISPDQPPPALDLSGTRVMVLPAQRARAPFPAGLDGEIRFFLEERGPRVDWIFPDELQRVADRNPTWNLRLDALSLGALRNPDVRDIGEPLYTDLRRLGALLDARVAMVPVGAGVMSRPEGEKRVEILAALIDTMGGRVIWYGVVAGETGADVDRRLVATAAEALARAMVPF